MWAHNLLKTIGSEERLHIQRHIDHTSMWTMHGVRVPTLLQPCSLFPSLYHLIDKAYGINISLPPYSNIVVVLTYLKSTYVFDCLQHLSTRLFLISITLLSMFHLHYNLQQKFHVTWKWNQNNKIKFVVYPKHILWFLTTKYISFYSSQNCVSKNPLPSSQNSLLGSCR